jgi:hypothetical protein
MKALKIALIGAGITVAAGFTSAAQAQSTQGTLRGGSGYEKQLEMSGMSGMAGMSGDHSSTVAKPKAKAKAKAKKTKAAKAAPEAAKSAN